MAGSQRPDLESVELLDGRVLPALHISDHDFYLVFGDGDAPNGTGKVVDRWRNNDKYLHQVADGFDTAAGVEFVVQKSGDSAIQMFSYEPKEPHRVAPCHVTETIDRKKLAVVFYSYGPK